MVVILALILSASYAWTQSAEPPILGHLECGSCHESHGAAPGQVLLPLDSVDLLCLSCHRGQKQRESGPAQLPEWSGRGSTHLPSEVSAMQDKDYERVIEQAGRKITLRMDCSGCHDPHGREPGKLKKVQFNSAGELIGEKALVDADVCYGCHAGPESVLLSDITQGALDLGSLFGPRSVSSHRMGQSARDRPDLPSLSGSVFRGTLNCSSCHDNPDPVTARGPHISIYPGLLKAPYISESNFEFVGEARERELCYECHQRESIEGNQSFRYHREHILGTFLPGDGSEEGFGRSGAFPPVQRPRFTGPQEGFGQSTPCATCHDPHGSVGEPALISFDPLIVQPSSMGGPDFQRISAGHGTCTLSCHGVEHVQKSY